MFTKEFIQSNFPKGKLTIIASRPAMGKTSFGISLAASLALEEKQVICFSLEYNEKYLAKRLSLQISEINAKAIGKRIYVDNTPSAKVSHMRSQLELKRFDFVIIDYLQLMDAECSQESRDDEVDEILTDLKLLAEEQNLPIVVLSQLSRDISGIDSRKPYIFSLRPYLAKVLNDVNVAFLYRPEYYRFYAKDAFGNKLEGKMEFIRYVNDNDIITPLHFNKETTEVSVMTTWGKLKEEILNSPRWYVNIDMYDLKPFECDNAEDIIVIESETTNLSENRLKAITESLMDQIKAIDGLTLKPAKAMINLQFPKSSPLIMEELTAVRNLVEEIIPANSDCEIMWGMCPREDDVSRMVCAIIPQK